MFSTSCRPWATVPSCRLTAPTLCPVPTTSTAASMRRARSQSASAFSRRCTSTRCPRSSTTRCCCSSGRCSSRSSTRSALWRRRTRPCCSAAWRLAPSACPDARGLLASGRPAPTWRAKASYSGARSSRRPSCRWLRARWRPSWRSAAWGTIRGRRQAWRWGPRRRPRVEPGKLRAPRAWSGERASSCRLSSRRAATCSLCCAMRRAMPWATPHSPWGRHSVSTSVTSASRGSGSRPRARAWRRAPARSCTCASGAWSCQSW
mmetsp:Transcript_19313/g.56058  ORF Transcript_19313/g.56058 Transcript_19313/m.56058 type:complete len:262 (+) Transcript_19313:1555-2340(+)